VEAPGVEVRDLRPFDRDDAEELTGPDGPGPARASRDEKAIEEGRRLGAEPVVE